jgi:hypothetical protein
MPVAPAFFRFFKNSVALNGHPPMTWSPTDDVLRAIAPADSYQELGLLM